MVSKTITATKLGVGGEKRRQKTKARDKKTMASSSSSSPWRGNYLAWVIFIMVGMEAGLSGGVNMDPKLRGESIEALVKAMRAAKAAEVMAEGVWNRTGLTRREKSSLGDCVDLMGEASDDLRDSIVAMKELNETNAGFRLNDAQTWVSAALTDGDTCLDGMKEANMRPSLAVRVETGVSKMDGLTTDALRLINKIAA